MSMYPKPGYAAGNLLNMLVHLGADLSGYDFSGLSVWQAYVQGVEVRNVNLTHAHAQQARFTHTFSRIATMAFSPDGRLLAVGTSNGLIQVWAFPSMTKLLEWRAHTGWVQSLCFSTDGQWIISGGDDWLVKVWHAATGRIAQTFAGHAKQIVTVACNHDGHIGSGSRDATVRIWDMQRDSGQQVFQHSTGDLIRSLAFRPGTSHLAIGSQTDPTIHLIDTDTGQRVRTLDQHSGGIHTLTFDASGNRLASGSNDTTIRIWDSGTCNCLRVLEGHTALVRAVAFSPDQRWLASSSDDGTIRIWDCETGTCLNTLLGHTSQVYTIAVHPNGITLASGGRDDTLRIWNALQAQCTHTVRGTAINIWSLDIHPSGSYIAAGGNDAAIHIWDIDSDQPPRRFLMRQNEVTVEQRAPGRVRAVAFSADGETLLGSRDDGSFWFWHATSGQRIERKDEPTNTIFALGCHPTRHLCASGDGAGRLHIRQWPPVQHLSTLTGHNDRIRSVAFSPSGLLLASGDADGHVHLWDTDTWQSVGILSDHAEMVWAVAFSHDSRYLATASSDRTVRVWDTSTQRCMSVLKGHAAQVTAVTFGADTNTVLSAADDTTLRVWDVSARVCRATWGGHTNRIVSLKHHANRKLLVSASLDGTIKVWDIQTGICTRTIDYPGPYEGMNITGATGLTDAQRETLKALGAVEDVR